MLNHLVFYTLDSVIMLIYFLINVFRTFKFIKIESELLQRVEQEK